MLVATERLPPPPPSPVLNVCAHTASMALHNILPWSLFCKKVTRGARGHTPVGTGVHTKPCEGQREERGEFQAHSPELTERWQRRQCEDSDSMLATWPRGRIASSALCSEGLQEKLLHPGSRTTRGSAAVSAGDKRPYFPFVSKIKHAPKMIKVEQRGFSNKLIVLVSRCLPQHTVS